MPPASPATTFACLMKSRRVDLPWSTCPKTATIGGRSAVELSGFEVILVHINRAPRPRLGSGGHGRAIFRSILAADAFCKRRPRHTLDSMFGFKKRIYLDYASATPVHPKAEGAFSVASRMFANPGAIHAEGVAAKHALTEARESLARHLGCKARELIFVSGLTEANNIALIGLARGLELRKRSLADTHWIVSSIEHSSVLECFAEIERMGGTVSHVEPDAKGIVRAEEVAALLRPATVLVSVGWGNNEIGTIQPLAAIARTLRAYEKTTSLTCVHKSDLSGIIFHSDAGQAPLHRSPPAHSPGVDMLALGSGKLYGPRCIGCLYLGNRASLSPTVFGGGQESGLRSGTEDVALATGFAAAFDEISSERDAETKRLRLLRDNFVREIITRISGIVVNGDLKHTLPHMLNISVPGERTGEYLVLALDHAGLSLSTKSACREGEANSHVVAALERANHASPSEALAKEGRATNTLRFSLGRGTTERELKHALSVIEKIRSD